MSLANFSVLDGEGAVLENPISDRIIHLSFGRLSGVDHVILVAAGEHKTEPLRAALRSGVVTRLVTDAECAQALLP